MKKSILRFRIIGVCTVLLFWAASVRGTELSQTGPDQPRPGPTLKKPEKPAATPSAVRKRYDAGRNLTYVSIDTPLVLGSLPSPVAPGAASSPPLKVVFQLVFRGSSTTDLGAGYLIIDSIASADQTKNLAEVRQVEIESEGYRFSYERVDYKIEQVPAGGPSPGAIATKKETLVFRLSTGDLPQIANANSIEIHLGKEVLTVNSVGLIDLRHALAGGA